MYLGINVPYMKKSMSLHTFVVRLNTIKDNEQQQMT